MQKAEKTVTYADIVNSYIRKPEDEIVSFGIDKNGVVLLFNSANEIIGFCSQSHFNLIKELLPCAAPNSTM